MISVEEAIETILAHVAPLGAEKVPILDALGRVLAEDVRAPRPLPPWDNSAMDGYAVRAEDVAGASRERPAVLRIVEDLPAGYTAGCPVGKGEAIRIMTGAPIPEGAGAVVMVELTERDGDRVRVFAPVLKGEDIRRAAEDVRAGDVVLPRGHLLNGGSIGMLASLGRASVHLYQRPTVAILATGDELVDVDGELAPGRIVNSNSYSLACQVRLAGGIPKLLGIARDRHEELERYLRAGLNADVILTTGGVSVGEYDFVKGTLGEMGTAMKFWRVAMKPGKPLAFGVVSGKPAFGLPGNPVSCMVSFEEFVRPALRKMQGHQLLFRPVVDAILASPLRKKEGRRHFVRSVLSRREEGYVAEPIKAQGSHILHSMVQADSLVLFPEEATELPAGSWVRVQLLDGALGGQEEPALVTPAPASMGRTQDGGEKGCCT
ncbi:MAG: gephyrin-like molybdotransferase Glp [Nitrospinota bacterium]